MMLPAPVGPRPRSRPRREDHPAGCAPPTHTGPSLGARPSSSNPANPAIGSNPKHTHPCPFTERFKELNRAVHMIATSSVPTPKAPAFRFEFSTEAAEFNTRLLERYDFDLTRAIASQAGTTMAYGSEFRPMDQLDTIFHRHPNYGHVRRNIGTGGPLPSDKLPEEERQSYLERAIAKGNHPSALTAEAKPVMDKLVHEDVRLAYGLPLTVEAIRHLKRAEVYPSTCRSSGR